MLEIGCGTGVVLSSIHSAFPAVFLTGSEVSTDGLAVAAARVNGARLVQMDGRKIPFENEFDVVGAFDVLEHIAEDETVLAQIWQAVVPGGGLVVSVPQHDWLWSGVDDYSRHQRRYSRRALVDKIAAAGFVVEHVTSFMSAVLPAMFLSRLTKRESATLDPAAELEIGPTTNFVLGLLCAGEREALTRGWTLPVGGSLLAVGRRADACA